MTPIPSNVRGMSIGKKTLIKEHFVTRVTGELLLSVFLRRSSSSVFGRAPIVNC